MSSKAIASFLLGRYVDAVLEEAGWTKIWESLVRRSGQIGAMPFELIDTQQAGHNMSVGGIG